jgi:peptidoglycan hydrolase CwlO-like protein
MNSQQLEQALRHAEEVENTLEAALQHRLTSLSRDRERLESLSARIGSSVQEGEASVTTKVQGIREKINLLSGRISSLKHRIEERADSLNQAVVGFKSRVEQDIQQVEQLVDGSGKALSNLDEQVEQAVNLVETVDERAEYLKGALSEKIDALKEAAESRQEELGKRLVEELGGSVAERVEQLLSRLQHIQAQLKSLTSELHQDAETHNSRLLETARHRSEERGRRMNSRAQALHAGFKATGSGIEATTAGLGVARDGVVAASTAANAGLGSVIGILRELVELFARVVP